MLLYAAAFCEIGYFLLFFLLSCMTGYINNTLSIARMGDQNILNEFSPHQMVTVGGLNVSHCRCEPMWSSFGVYFNVVAVSSWFCLPGLKTEA